jgi:hypothetical protein
VALLTSCVGISCRKRSIMLAQHKGTAPNLVKTTKIPGTFVIDVDQLSAAFQHPPGDNPSIVAFTTVAVAQSSTSIRNDTDRFRWSARNIANDAERSHCSIPLNSVSTPECGPRIGHGLQ